MLAASVSILLVCPFLALTLFQIPARAGFLSKNCSTPNTYARGSAFESNLRSLLDSLRTNATLDGGSYALSLGNGPDKVYGLFMCYADASLDNCWWCLKDATSVAPGWCEGQATAIFYYDECLLRYSRKDFLSQVADFNDHICINNSASPLDDESKNLVTNLISNASMGAEQDPQLTAYRETKTNTRNISALVQCTRDLSQDGCRQCLQGGNKSGFSACSHNFNSTGMRLMYGSCYIRYESYSLHITFPPPAAGSTVPGPEVAPAVDPAPSPVSDPERGKSFGTF